MGILDHLVPKLFTELPLSNVKVLVTIHKKKKKSGSAHISRKKYSKEGKKGESTPKTYHTVTR